MKDDIQDLFALGGTEYSMPPGKSSRKYIQMYIYGLDRQIQGGIPAGHIVLVAGQAGSMKSSFAFNILYNNVRSTKARAIYVTLEQSRQSLIEQMENLNMDTETVKRNLAIVDIGVLRQELKDITEDMNWFDALDRQISTYKENIGYDILAIDSLDALYVMSKMTNPRKTLFHFFGGLRALGLTTMLVTEMGKSSDEFGRYGVESFLADGIIHLDMERSGGTVNRFISIVKMRGVRHSTDYFPLIVDDGVFKIGFKIT